MFLIRQQWNQLKTHVILKEQSKADSLMISFQEVFEIMNDVMYTGFLFTNITGCVRIPKAESQIGELSWSATATTL